MYVAHEDDHWTDEIRIVTVPRYKTSGLSGDEWRFRYRIEFWRKGEVWAQKGVNNLNFAVAEAAAAIHLVDFELTDRGWEVLRDPRLDGTQCANPGCAEAPTVEYRMKQRGCPRCGEMRESFGDERRAFCARHSTRGDCGLDDADRNYEIVKGDVQRPSLSDESPSIFGGIIEIGEAG